MSEQELVDAINALPDRLRRYVYDLETRADPAGEVRELFFAREEVAALRVQLAAGERHHDAAMKANALTDEQWLRIEQIRELVKQEGDARCEAAFDDLAGEVVRLRDRLATAEARVAVLLEALTSIRQREEDAANRATWGGDPLYQRAVANIADIDATLQTTPCEVCQGRGWWLSKEGAEIPCDFCRATPSEETL